MRKMVMIMAAVAVCAALAGCAKMQHNYVPSAEQADWPPLNQETVVHVGDEMLIQGAIIKQKILEVGSLIDGACYDIPPGQYRMTGHDEKGQYFQHMGTNGMVTQAALCDPLSGLYVPTNKPGEVCIITVFGGTSCFSGSLKIREIESAHAESNQRSLLYSGMDGKKIKFTYVERRSGGASFSHDVSYDTKISTTINYRGAQLKIISSNNEQITYVVLKNFTDRQK